MSVNQRLRALAGLGQLDILGCYPDSFPDDVAEVAQILRLPITQSMRKGPLRVAAFGAEALVWSILQRVRRRRYDLVYCFQDPSAAVGLLMRGSGTGWVIDALDDPALELRNAVEQGKALKWRALTVRDRLFSLLTSRADLVVTIGSSADDPLPLLLHAEYGVARDRILPLVQALDLERLAPPVPTIAEGTPPAVFYVGWVSPLRGILTLIDAGKSLKDKGVDVELRLAGHLKAADRQWLEDVGASHPGLVHYVGIIASTHTMEEIGNASICVCPFPERRELVPVQPVKVLEYMAAGKPVVASRLPGTSAIIEDGVNGLLVNPGDPQQLADAIEKLLVDDDLRRSLGEAAKLRVTSFDVTIVNRRLQEALARWL